MLEDKLSSAIEDAKRALEDSENTDALKKLDATTSQVEQTTEEIVEGSKEVERAKELLSGVESRLQEQIATREREARRKALQEAETAQVAKENQKSSNTTSSRPPVSVKRLTSAKWVFHDSPRTPHKVHYYTFNSDGTVSWYYYVPDRREYIGENLRRVGDYIVRSDTKWEERDGKVYWEPYGRELTYENRRLYNGDLWYAER